MEPIEKRKEELERAANVKMIEAGAISLEPGDEKKFKVKDIQAWQRVRTRLLRLGRETKRSYFTKLEGNKLTIRRGA